MGVNDDLDSLHHEPILPGPRGAVGGCTTPGSRVDSWWNFASYSPSISSPGPPRIDEGPQTENNQFQYNSLAQQRANAVAYQNHHLQPNLNQPYTSHQRHREAIHLQEQQQHHQLQSILRNPEVSFTNASTPVQSSSNFEFVNSPIIQRNSNNACSDPTNPFNLISNSLLPLPDNRPYHNKISNHLSLNLNNNSETTEAQSLNSEASPPRRNTVLSSLLNSGSIDRSISPSTSCTSASPDSFNGLLSTLSAKIKPESCEERSIHRSIHRPPSNSLNNSLLSSILTASRTLIKKKKQSLLDDHSNNEDIENNNQNIHNNDIDIEERSFPVKIEYSNSNPTSPNQILKEDSRQQQFGGISDKNSISSCCDIVPRSANTDIAIDMKFESQAGLPTPPSHLTSSGVDHPHSSQGSHGIVSEVEGVESILLSSWGSSANDFLEAQDVKQNSGLHDAWDSILLEGSPVSVTTPQPLADMKPLPPFIGYTGHLSINGIQGHHYHTIASSAQRAPLQSSSPTSSSNQEYYESSVVSSSTPCPQASQKQHHHQSHQHSHTPHQQQQQQQQLPQSTQQSVDYDMEDIAEIIGSAIADTTVSAGGGQGNAGNGNAGSGGNAGGGNGNNNGPSDWIDIAEWIDTTCSSKEQETDPSSPYSQMYATAPTTTAATTNPTPQQQSHGSTLQSLLTHGYSPLLHARLQGTGNQNSSCGETPSSTSPFPPVSPPGRVSTSCSPDHMLHSSFGTPSHTRKRPRPPGGSHNTSKKSLSTATALSYGTDSNLISGKEKPVHRCSICNRGFLNKSNIKVHLRTHTGEKPFRCEVCGKAFRQKAHLIKHQQIHKRIGRD